MNTIFKNIADILDEGCDINITVRRNSDKLVCSVSFNNNAVKDGAKELIPPFVLSGTPQEMDEGFIDAVKEPMEKSKGLQSSMKDYEASLKTAMANSKQNTHAKQKEADAKKKEEDAQKKKSESFKKALEQANKLKAEKKWKEAIKAYQQALPYADEAGKKKVEDLITLCKNNDQPMMFDAFDEDTQEAAQEPQQNKDTTEATDDEPELAPAEEETAPSEPQEDEQDDQQEQEDTPDEEDPFSDNEDESEALDWTNFDEDDE